MTQPAKNIAVLIPCYNEGSTIAKVVADFRTALPEATIYVYDNNSTDNTVLEAERAGAVVRYERRQGKGNVIRTMFREVEADCYLMVDGDDTYPAEHARDMCRIVLERGADMVIGDRLSSTYFDENKRPMHGVGNRLVRALINRMFHSHVKDIMTGYRAFSRLFVKHFPVLSKGFEIETEMTVHALDKNFLLEEIPVTYRDRPAGSVSKLNTLADGCRVLRTVFRLFRDYRPLAFFGWLAVLAGLLAVALFVPVAMDYWQTGLVPRFPTLIVAVVLGAAALLLWVCGLVLDAIALKHRQLYELLLNAGVTYIRPNS